MTEISELERIARLDNLIDEIDGPARSYFEIPFNNQIMRITYVSLVWPITQEHVEDNMQNRVAEQLMTAIKDQLFKLGGGIIWWRKRPELSVYDGLQGQIFKIRCRVATSPPLSNEAWDSLHKQHEGELIR